MIKTSYWIFWFALGLEERLSWEHSPDCCFVFNKPLISLLFCFIRKLYLISVSAILPSFGACRSSPHQPDVSADALSFFMRILGEMTICVLGFCVSLSLWILTHSSWWLIVPFLLTFISKEENTSKLSFGKKMNKWQRGREKLCFAQFLSNQQWWLASVLLIFFYIDNLQQLFICPRFSGTASVSKILACCCLFR